jgi:hypothetical protein
MTAISEMRIRNPLPAVLPILASSISMAYGGYAIAFYAISSFPLVGAGLASKFPLPWALEFILGMILFICGLGTILGKDLSRRVMHYGLFASGSYELGVGSMGLSTGEPSYNFLVILLFAAAWIAVLPSSIQYTRRAMENDPRFCGRINSKSP